MHPLFEECSSSCGFLAAFVSCLCFGSFCVPMKSEAARKLDVDPLVFQTYKTSMCFISSFMVLLLGVDKLTFTPWGIVSGLFWVPGGVMHVCGVRTAGLAISQGTSSSIIVLVAFSWGIFIFHERVKSVASACFSILLMIGGIVGMSYFSAPPSSSSTTTSTTTTKPLKANYLLNNKKHHNNSDGAPFFKISIPPSFSTAMDSIFAFFQSTPNTTTINQSSSCDESIELTASMDSSCTEISSASNDTLDVISHDVEASPKTPKKLVRLTEEKNSDKLQTDKQTLNTDNNDDDVTETDMIKKLKLQKNNGTYAIVSSCAYYLKNKYNIDISIRQMGICFSAGGAIWGGSVLVPLHFAGDETKGLSYVFSFAVGATLVNIALWIVRYHYLYKQHGDSHSAAWHSLPAFHIKTMALPGALSGFLYSVGNVCGILSVTYLGEGVGYSMTQSAMLVSGMWGIFWFHEITSIHAIRGWMASACLAIAGILLLSYNHLPPPPRAMLKG